MLTFRDRFHLSFGFCLILALMLLTVPLKWCIASLLAGLIHELAHILALKLCRCPVIFTELGASGAVIASGSLTPGQRLFCALAGPVSGLLLLPLCPLYPRLSLCAAVQSLYNLLPLSVLDGGTILRSFAQLFFRDPTVQRICTVVQGLCLTLLTILGLYTTAVLQVGLFPAAALALLYLKLLKGKKSCKSVQHRVQ